MTDGYPTEITTAASIDGYVDGNHHFSADHVSRQHTGSPY